MGYGLCDEGDNKQTKSERVKLQSKHLRGKIPEQLINEKDKFSKPMTEILKFHGIYQQLNRDKDFDMDAPHNPHTFMIRSRIAGGRMTAEQWKMYDFIADEWGFGSIRFTTRQTIQLHWITKGDVKSTLQGIHKVLLTTTGGCGDIVRNVMCAPNPLKDPKLALLEQVTVELSDHFKAASNAYNELWLDGEQQNPETEEEKLFGDQYLPRKFKICVTLEGNNSIDLFTHDLGLAATLNADDQIEGYFVFVGGGQGRTHNSPETFPCSAMLLGWIKAEQLIPIAEGIVTTQRDYGDRTSRKHARMKYLVRDRGIDWFRQQVEERSGVTIDLEKTPPPWEIPSYLGFHEQTDGKWSLGIHILSGRVMDKPGYFIKSALRKIFGEFNLSCQITADQDLILVDIEEKDKEAIQQIFNNHHVNITSPSPLYNRALSCVAMPTCGLAITESERYLPFLLPEIQKILEMYDLGNLAPVFRIVGCPNGCCRPYNAELALIGQAPGLGPPPSPGKYQIWAGGSLDGERLGFHVRDMVPAEEMSRAFHSLFNLWFIQGEPGERFGDFATRVGKDVLDNSLKWLPEE